MSAPARNTEEWRRTHRLRMAGIREKKKARIPKECRQCAAPAAICDRTGRLLSMCDRHLKLDRKRKSKKNGASK